MIDDVHASLIYIIGFQSEELLKKNFKCRLKANILRAKGLPQEASVVERAITSRHPDPYVSIDVEGRYGFDRGTTYVAVRSHHHFLKS